MDRREAIGVLGLYTQTYAQASARARLLGAWRLRSSVLTFKDGHVERPYGDKPLGRIEYGKGRRMSVLLMRPGRGISLPPGMPLNKASCEDLHDVLTGFVAYFGTFDVEETTQTVIHHAEASLLPESVGADLKRRFRFDESRLILTRPAPPYGSGELTWERESD
ncbi:MAG: lipocalin-like domain-containing protein [Bryobacteraceae bacterium]